MGQSNQSWILELRITSVCFLCVCVYVRFVSLTSSISNVSSRNMSASSYSKNSVSLLVWCSRSRLVVWHAFECFGWVCFQIWKTRTYKLPNLFCCHSKCIGGTGISIENANEKQQTKNENKSEHDIAHFRQRSESRDFTRVLSAIILISARGIVGGKIVWEFDDRRLRRKRSEDNCRCLF